MMDSQEDIGKERAVSHSDIAGLPPDPDAHLSEEERIAIVSILVPISHLVGFGTSSTCVWLTFYI